MGYFTGKLQLQLYRKGKLREWKQAIEAQQPVKKEERQEERRFRPVVVETKRVKSGQKKGQGGWGVGRDLGSDLSSLTSHNGQPSLLK